jgi:pyruvate dehydrogenase E1 component alpha subunit
MSVNANSPAGDVDAVPDAGTLLEIYRRAALIMRNDGKLRAAIRQGKLVTPYYPPRGQEIIPSAVSVCLTDADYIVTIYRGMHDQVAKGLPLKLLWAEYAGRTSGACKGKGGPMHITHPASGVMVTTGIVGSGIPIANGMALASLLRGDQRVTVTYFGDGASNIGAFHEALNMASLWKLPVVFVCQNNRFAEHSAFSLGTAVRTVSDRAAAYTMPGVSVDGNDALAMWREARRAIERARNGGGPTLLEAHTFRFEGHNMGDAGEYIPKEMMAEARALDPVPQLRALLLQGGHATEPQLVDLESQMDREIDEAAKFAFDSPFAGIDELRRDVYAEEIPV